MDPDEVARTCSELHPRMHQISGAEPHQCRSTDDWQRARLDFLADLAKLEDEQPPT